MNPKFKTIVHNYLRIMALLFLLSFATESQAHAYADPGSGALIWQLFAASLLAVPFYLRKALNWIRKKAKKQ
jgi:hypothetical protein